MRHGSGAGSEEQFEVSHGRDSPRHWDLNLLLQLRQKVCLFVKSTRVINTPPQTHCGCRIVVFTYSFARGVIEGSPLGEVSQTPPPRPRSPRRTSARARPGPRPGINGLPSRMLSQALHERMSVGRR